MVNGGLFADARTHPWQRHTAAAQPAGCPRDAGDGSARRARSRRAGSAHACTPAATILPRPTLPSCGRRSPGGTGPRSPTNAAGFTAEHRRHAQRWDLAAIARDLVGTVALYVGGSEQDPYEHRQIPATRQRVPQAEILTFPGGHLTTSEHPGLLAAAIRDIAQRHGVGTSAAAHR